MHHEGLHIHNIKFTLPHFLDEFDERNNVTKGQRHSYVLSFGHQKFGGPNDGAGYIKHHHSALRLVSASIGCCKLFIPVACEVGIILALEVFGKVWLEAMANITCGLEIFDDINNYLSVL